MKLILSPKDNIGKMVLKDVECFTLEGETLLVVFKNGFTRNYPLIHLWYYQSHVDYHKIEEKEVVDLKIDVCTCDVSPCTCK